MQFPASLKNRVQPKCSFPHRSYKNRTKKPHQDRIKIPHLFRPLTGTLTLSHAAIEKLPLELLSIMTAFRRPKKTSGTSRDRPRTDSITHRDSTTETFC